MVQTSESHNADTMYTRIKNYFNIDRQQLALNLVWYWAWVGLKFTKIVEYIFRLVLSLPNGLLVYSQPDIKTTAGQKIELLNALDERGDVILNKLNLFLKKYWEVASDATAHETNGFDFRKLSKFINCTVLVCTYILNTVPAEVERILSEDDRAAMSDNDQIETKRLVVEIDNQGNCYKVVKGKRVKLFLGHTDFDTC